MMPRCLRARTLLKLVAEAGTAAQRSHLTSCQNCHSRYQRLVRQFQAIERTLLTTDPPLVVHYRIQAPSCWVPATAVLACILLLSWQGTWRSSTSPVKASSSAASSIGPEEEIDAFLEEAVAPALFASTETEQATFSTATFFDDDDSTILASDTSVILADQWPCDENDLFAVPSCELMTGSATLEEF